ncbi:MAG TPA: hypothetical protein VJN94_07785, partial [Candidatus Binataceae bacterium]|nr:hypothetical protein [Candidatus Binataceae bacterium]
MPIIALANEIEGAGSTGCTSRTRGNARKKKTPQVRRTIGNSLRNGLRLMARSPRGTGLVSPRRLQAFARGLDTSVGASGRHAFAVRLRAIRLWRENVHRIPH